MLSMRNITGISIILSAIILTGCGTAKTVVLEAPDVSTKFNEVELVANNPTVNVPEEVDVLLRTTIEKGLIEEGSFVKGNDLQIQYTFVNHDEGSRAARWFWGGLGNAGEGTVTVMVVYLDKDQKELAKTQVEGKIGSGFFGGSMNEAIVKAGEDIVEFTKQNFSE